MALFFSRRTFSGGGFGDNVAALTRYVRITTATGSTGNLLDRDDWLAAVEGEAQSDDVLILVHGFNTSQPRMLNRQRLVSRGLKANGYRGAVVSFDWPSDGKLLRYRSDRNDAKRVANDLVLDGILPMLRRPRRLRVHLLAQSMGAYLLLRGLAGVGDPTSGPSWGVDQVLFAAADVDSEWLQAGAWGSLVIEKRVKRFTNFYSLDDRVLQLAVITSIGTERAGRSGLLPAKPSNAVDLYCSLRYRAIEPEGQTLNFSHNWYYEDEHFLQDASLTLQGTADASMPTRQSATNGDRVLRA